MSKSEEEDQLVKCKDTELYIPIDHDETIKVFLRKQYRVSKENMKRLPLLHEMLTDTI